MEISLNWFSNATYGVQDSAFIASSRIDALLDLTIEIKTSRVRRGGSVKCELIGNAIQSDIEVSGAIDSSFGVLESTSPTTLTVLVSPSASRGAIEYNFRWTKSVDEKQSTIVPTPVSRTHVIDAVFSCRASRLRYGASTVCGAAADGKTFFPGDLQAGDFDSNLNRPVPDVGALAMTNDSSFTFAYTYTAPIASTATSTASLTALSLSWASAVGSGPVLTATRSSSFPVSLVDLQQSIFSCPSSRVRPGGTVLCTLSGTPVGNLNASDFQGIVTEDVTAGTFAPTRLGSFTSTTAVFVLPFTASSVRQSGSFRVSAVWNRTAVGGSANVRVSGTLQSALFLIGATFACTPEAGRVRRSDLIRCTMTAITLNPNDQALQPGDLAETLSITPPEAGTTLSLSTSLTIFDVIPACGSGVVRRGVAFSCIVSPAQGFSLENGDIIGLNTGLVLEFSSTVGGGTIAIPLRLYGAPAQLRVNQSRLAVIKSFPTAAGRVGVEIEVSPTSDDQDPPSVVEAVLTTLGPYFSGNWLGSTFPEPLFFANDSGPYSCGGGQPIVFSHILFPVVVQRSLPPWTEAALEDFKPFLLGPGLQLVAPLTAAPDNTLVATLQALPWNPALTQSNVTLLYTAGDSTLHVDVTRDTVPPGTLHLALGAAPSPSPTPDRPPPSETSALLSLTIDIPYNSISSSFETFVLDRVFKNLNQGSTKVSRNRLIIQSIRPGSVIVVVEILASAASGETSPSQVLSQLKTPLPTSWLSPQLPLKSSSITINTPPAPSPLPGSSGTSDGLSAGAIAGIVIGSIAGFFLLVGVACWVYFGLLAKPVPAFLAPVHNLFKPLTEYSLYWDGYIPKLRRLRQIPPPTEPQKSRAGSFADTMAAAKPRASPTGSASAGSGSLVVELEFSGCRDADVRSRQWEIPGAAIVVFDRKGNEEQRKKGRQLSTRVEFTGLLPGEKNVEVMAKAVTIVSSQVRVAAGAERVESIELEKVPLVVRVLNPDGSPASGLALSLSPATGARVDGMDETDAAGDVLFLVDPAALGDGHGSVTALRNGKTLAKFEDAEELFPFSLSIFNHRKSKLKSLRISK
eukprot:tig00000828_g4639.t1